MTAQAAPTAPDRTQRRRYARWRPRTALIVVAVGLVISQVLALAVALAAGGRDGLDWVAASGLVLADAFLIGMVLAFARRGAERLGAATFGIRRTAFWPALGWMVLAYFAVSVFNAIWLTLVGTGGTGDDGGGSAGSPSTAAIVFVVAGVAVAAPIAEEIVFRGYLFPALARWRGPWIGALLGAAVFGAAHCLVYPPQLLPLMAMFGFAACMLFWFTGSLLPGVALHASNNALVTGIDLGWSWQVPLLMVGCMSLALLLLAPFARERAPQPTP
jgi:membrane protease YdiL (CAAX protease family)